METNKQPIGTLDPRRIKRVVKSLTLVDMDVTKLEDRLPNSKIFDDSALCIIDITCCIIDCTKCAPEGGEVISFPEAEGRIKGFAFKLPKESRNRNAPLYFVPELEVRDAFRMGHRALKVPGNFVEGRILGIAGEIFSEDILSKNAIAPTAPVIGLVPKR